MNWPAKVVRSFVRGLGAFSPNCKEAALLQSAALDRKLTLLEQFGLRCHLVLCHWCRRYGQQINFLCSAARSEALHDQPTPRPALPPEARERIKRRLATEKR